MPNPDQQPIDLGDKFPQLRDMKYLVVDTEGGFLAKNTRYLLNQMGYGNVDILFVDAIEVTPEQMNEQINSSGMIICADAEAESRIRTVLGDNLKPVISLQLNAQDRYEAAPHAEAGSPSTDSSRIITLLENKLVRFGFDYQQTT